MKAILDELFEILSWEEDRLSESSVDLIHELQKRYSALQETDLYSGFDNYDFND